MMNRKSGHMNIGLIVAVVVVVFLLLFVLPWVLMAQRVSSAPARVVSKTLDTNNIINNYEWYHDAHAQYTARLGQIRSHTELWKSADGAERNNLRIELSAMQQSCRELATAYNANSQKINRSIFKGTSLPETLEIEQCGN